MLADNEKVRWLFSVSHVKYFALRPSAHVVLPSLAMSPPCPYTAPPPRDMSAKNAQYALVLQKKKRNKINWQHSCLCFNQSRGNHCNENPKTNGYIIIINIRQLWFWLNKCYVKISWHNEKETVRRQSWVVSKIITP